VQLGKVFPVSFHFAAFFVAQFVITYWAGMLAVHYLLMSTYDKLAQIEPSKVLTSTLNSCSLPTATGSLSPSLLSCEHSNQWKLMVKNICQSVEYFLQDRMGISGPLTMIAPLRGCKRDLGSTRENWNREISWMTDCLALIRKKLDFPVDNIFGD
jgi:hypothetical protein